MRTNQTHSLAVAKKVENIQYKLHECPVNSSKSDKISDEPVSNDIINQRKNIKVRIYSSKIPLLKKIATSRKPWSAEKSLKHPSKKTEFKRKKYSSKYFIGHKMTAKKTHIDYQNLLANFSF